MKSVLSCITILALSVCAFAQENPTAIQGRRADLEQLKSALLTRHPNPFAYIERSEWESALDTLEAKLEGMSRNRFGVELQRLVALLGDAHTAVNPQDDTAFSKRRYPVELYLFEDGLYVRRAAPEYADLAGGKVIRVGKVDAGKAIAAVAPTISHENLWWIRARAPERLVIPEVLDGLGLVNDPENLPLTVEKDGARSTAMLPPVTVSSFTAHDHGLSLDKSNWSDMQASGDLPLWRQHPGDLMWHTWLEDGQSLYVCYRAVTSEPEGLSNSAFWDGVFAAIDGRRPRRVIIDIRENSGGNGMLNRGVIQQIVRRPEIDRSDRLFVIIGRRTFSAAQQLANQLDWWTQATFVGEPTGQRVSQYGDSDRIVLANSGFSVHISTLFHQAPDPRDNRVFIPPDIYAPLTSEEYRNGDDPALEAVMASEGSGQVMARFTGALQAGQFDAAERIIAGAAMDPSNRYRNFEPDINAIGYDLLSRGRTEAAIEVFRINTRVYPGSANTYDSLGEALTRAGRHEEAVEAYRTALEIDPTFAPSLQALHRLEDGRER